MRLRPSRGCASHAAPDAASESLHTLGPLKNDELSVQQQQGQAYCASSGSTNLQPVLDRHVME